MFAVAGNKIPLLNDDFANVSGRPMSLKALITGAASRDNKENHNVYISISGDFFPAEPDLPVLSLSATGQVNRDNIDLPLLQSLFTGNVTGEPFDVSSISLFPSGNYQSGYNIQASVSFDYYVFISGAFNEKSDFIVGFTGKFQKNQQDTAGLDFNLFSISYSAGAGIISFLGTDSAGVDFKFTTITWTAA